MAEAPKVFISHTTRDRRDHALAHRLAVGLRDRGSEVWIAPDNIPVGSDWQREIVSAIVADCSHFLVIISAASTTAEWVLKEIQLAKERKEADACFTILPLVVGATNSYDGEEFIAQFQRIPYQDDLSRQLDAIANALHLRPPVPSKFAKLTQEFLGRDYVFSAIDGFLDRYESGYFTLVGDPGEGKSAILTEFVKRTGCVAHFNLRAAGINRAEQCVKSINAQLCARFGLSLEPPSDPAQLGQHWDDLFQHASTQIDDGDGLVIAIDALDEVDLADHPTGANILFLPPSLPRGIYIVLTRRRKRVPFVIRSSQQIFDLIDHREQSLADIKRYIRRAMTRGDLAKWIARRDVTPGNAIDELAGRSEWNFMYLHYVLPKIENGRYHTFAPKDLPHGLRGYYADHWEQMGMRDDPLPRDKIRIVYLMAEVGRPVSRSLLAQFAGQDPIVVQHVIDEWRQFLHEQIDAGETRYSVYHTSFLDFLHDKDIVKAAGETIPGVHAAIADNLWQELMGDD